MTEVISEPIVPAATDDIDFGFDGMHHDGNNDDDFDFDLGKEEPEEPELSEQYQQTMTKEASQSVVTDHVLDVQEIPAVEVDEISYDDGALPAEQENDVDGIHAHLDGAVEQKQDETDEIDYEDVDLNEAALDAGAATAASGEEEEMQEPVPQEAHEGIDFGFETNQAAADLSDNDVAEEDEVEASLHADDDDAQATDDMNDDVADDEDEQVHGVDEEADEEEEEEEEEAAQEDAEYETGDKDMGDGDFDFEEDDGESPGGSLNAGLDQLYTPGPESSADVTVTWGNDVCPLFKASDVASPDSFFLEDREAVNYPLAKFLQTVRSGIASWMHGGDEIFIRIDDLGIEFGETTTEALLHQVTFHNLLALHNTLLTNDDANASKGLHITLGTRPNCLLRLKELVSGAAQGKGLSSFQQGAGSSDESSEEEEENVEESDESSPNDDEMGGDEAEDDEEEEEEEEEEDDGSAPTPEADMADAPGLSIYDGEEAELAAAEEDQQSGDYDAAAEENEDSSGVIIDEVIDDHTDFIDYENEEGTDDVSHEMATGTGSDPAPVPDISSAGYADADNGLVAETETHGRDDLEQNDLDLLEDFPAEEASGQEQDAALTHLEPVNGLEPIGIDNQHGERNYDTGDAGHDEDDFLDLGEDHADTEEAAVDQTADSAADQMANQMAAGDDLDASLGTSVTATADHDEIDYEDHDTVATGADLGNDDKLDFTAPQLSQPGAEGTTEDTAGLDEIDWDDEVKNGAPSEAISTPTTGKRTREEGLEDLIGDVPDIKRHRTGESPV